MHLEEGEQYFVNRILFTGNTTTKDHVVRREMALLEGGVFNTEGLKYSIKRINQLGYFQPLGEGEAQDDIQAEKTAEAKNKVDVTLNLDERNRNALMFGAGMSGIDGLFVNASFATTNFLGQGETLQVSVQTGERASNYQLSASEPYLFGRPITAGATLFSRKDDLYMDSNTVGYSEVRSGMSLLGGLPVARFGRAYTTYTYEVVDTAVHEDFLSTGGSEEGEPAFNPFLNDGRYIESRQPYKENEMFRFLTGAMLLFAAPLMGSCESPTETEDVDDSVDVTAPGTVSARDGSNRSFVIQRGDDPAFDETRPYDWRVSFTVTMTLTEAAVNEDDWTFQVPIKITSSTVDVQTGLGRHRDAAHRDGDCALRDGTGERVQQRPVRRRRPRGPRTSMSGTGSRNGGKETLITVTLHVLPMTMALRQPTAWTFSSRRSRLACVAIILLGTGRAISRHTRASMFNRT